MTYGYHEPVLTKTIVDYLGCQSDGTYVDVTLGGGGWSEAILEASKPDGRVVGFDQDSEAIKTATERLSGFGKRFETVHAPFSKMKEGLQALGITAVQGIVADLGVSSHQINEGRRGFSFMKEAPLDMRMDDRGETTAYDLINSYDAETLANWIFEYGDERFSRRIARAIVEKRGESPIETTTRLAEIVARAIPGGGRHGRIHPATRTFQALRIVVNNEMGELERLVEDAPEMLAPGARLVVISYHSLEDRIVKHRFVELGRDDRFFRVTKKPIRPDGEEVKRNPRARSARLRVLERVG